MNKNTRISTTIKLYPTWYDTFKFLGIRHRLTLQALIERTVFRYNNEEAFRNEMNDFLLPPDPADTIIPVILTTPSTSEKVTLTPVENR